MAVKIILLQMISKLFLITWMIWALIGAAMSIIFRLQLGFPEADLSFLKPLLGKWIVVNEGIGKLEPEFYYALVTMHGTIIVFFVLTAGLSGTFSNLLIPLQLGARDMASGFLNMLSYWFFFLSSIVMFYSLFLSTGPFSGGWTAYPPLSALPQASIGSGAGMTLWVVSLVLFVCICVRETLHGGELSTCAPVLVLSKWSKMFLWILRFGKYFCKIMKIDNFRGDLTGVAAVKRFTDAHLLL